MDWNDLLGRRYAVRWLFGLIVFALVILLVTRFAILPRIWAPREPLGPFNSTYPNSALFMIDAAVATLLTVGLTGTFLLLLVPRSVRDGIIVTVHPKDIDAELKVSVQSTREYFFKGRSGRYFRSTILPLIEAGSRTSSSTRIIWLLLPDPSDQPLMESYAHFRNAAAFRGKADDWTVSSIQTEIIAAIIALAEKTCRNPYLDIHIALSKSFSILRVDMTDASVIITRDDPKLPAFKAGRGTIFYESYREDIQLSIRQAGELNLLSVWPDKVEVDESSIAAAMTALGFETAAQDLGNVAEVQAAISGVTNPYA